MLSLDVYAIGSRLVHILRREICSIDPVPSKVCQSLYQDGHEHITSCLSFCLNLTFRWRVGLYFMERIFLYIDILGFSKMVEEQPSKIPQIFNIINGLSVHYHSAFQVIVFSDTILAFNKDSEMPNHYYVTYLIEFAQQLFYRLLTIGVYYKGIITYGDFYYSELDNIQTYWGHALIDAYTDEKGLEGMGLFVRKDISDDILILEKETINAKYDFVYLCQSYMSLYKRVKGLLPIDLDVLTETDEFCEIDEDLHFFREIEYIKDNHPSEKVRMKYDRVYNWYKIRTPEFFEYFEKQGFYPMVLNPGYTGSFYPFNLIAENELNNNIR